MSDARQLFEEVCEGFLRRNTRLRSPASALELNALKEEANFKIPDHLINLYSAFDGFEDNHPDDLSMITIWSAGRVREWIREPDRSVESIRWLAFADLYLDADLIVTPIYEQAGTVWVQDEKRIIASDVLSFCRQIINGDHDGVAGLQLP